MNVRYQTMDDYIQELKEERDKKLHWLNTIPDGITNSIENDVQEEAEELNKYIKYLENGGQFGEFKFKILRGRGKIDE